MKQHSPSPSGSHADPKPFLSQAGLLRQDQVLKLYPVSRSTWCRGVRSGRYPQPVRLGLRAVAWKASDIAILLEKGGA